ncbi:sulfite exporter TauE/SafE family protein [Halanaerobium sp. Z-7514]|uniref:Probable membrane transporter protein n=1 Tax=Halanaerobium polyolivorans TaxID=2886943 RepID=A0AAW4X2G5_9FIRM|nr:sulfite exporter TauE/SafE family protein [Halanaerobium polyolivorans]MCC3145978.1 sulfite exporter TauE/SafE family protein [Halanaerobium polyolivorans]
MFEILVIIFAGFGAGIVTGLVGASAVVIVTPFLVIFLGYDPYSAIGISLATDVVASSVSAFTYSKHGNINIKGGLLIAISAVIAAIFGSWFSAGMTPTALGGLTGIIILLTGISFRRKPINQRVEEFKNKFELNFFREREKLSSVLFGTFIGLMTGIFGAGGGIMILMVLTFVLDYKTHMAIGTSVLIMTFTALFASASHFIVEQHIPYFELLLSGFFAFAGAVTAATFANGASEKKLSKAIGTAFIFLGLIVILN